MASTNFQTKTIYIKRHVSDIINIRVQIYQMNIKFQLLHHMKKIFITYNHNEFYIDVSVRRIYMCSAFHNYSNFCIKFLLN